MKGKRRNGWQQISEKEVHDAVSKMKCGKDMGLVIKYGGKAVIEWFVRLFNVCYQTGEVPEN